MPTQLSCKTGGKVSFKTLKGKVIKFDPDKTYGQMWKHCKSCGHLFNEEIRLMLQIKLIQWIMLQKNVPLLKKPSGKFSSSSCIFGWTLIFLLVHAHLDFLRIVSYPMDFMCGCATKVFVRKIIARSMTGWCAVLTMSWKEGIPKHDPVYVKARNFLTELLYFFP